MDNRTNANMLQLTRVKTHIKLARVVISKVKMAKERLTLKDSFGFRGTKA